jgi:hypothetical protein
MISGARMTTIQTAYDRFSKKRFPLPSESQLTRLEQEIRVVFPDDYRRFVLDFNGGYFKRPEIAPVGEGCPLEALESLYGIGASHPTSELGDPGHIGLFDDNEPPKIFPIGATPMGDLIILDTAPGLSYGRHRGFLRALARPGRAIKPPTFFPLRLRDNKSRPSAFGSSPAQKRHSIDARSRQIAEVRRDEDERDDSEDNQLPAVLHGGCPRFGCHLRRILAGLDVPGGHLRRDIADDEANRKIKDHAPNQAHERTPGHKTYRLPHKG